MAILWEPVRGTLFWISQWLFFVFPREISSHPLEEKESRGAAGVGWVCVLYKEEVSLQLGNVTVCMRVVIFLHVSQEGIC